MQPVKKHNSSSSPIVATFCYGLIISTTSCNVSSSTTKTKAREADEVELVLEFGLRMEMISHSPLQERLHSREVTALVF